MTQVTEKNLLEMVGKCVAMLFSTAISMTDAHLKSQQACCKDGFISFLLQELLPKLHNIKWNKVTVLLPYPKLFGNNIVTKQQ